MVRKNNISKVKEVLKGVQTFQPETKKVEKAEEEVIDIDELSNELTDLINESVLDNYMSELTAEWSIPAGEQPTQEMLEELEYLASLADGDFEESEDWGPYEDYKEPEDSHDHEVPEEDQWYWGAGCLDAKEPYDPSLDEYGGLDFEKEFYEGPLKEAPIDPSLDGEDEPDYWDTLTPEEEEFWRNREKELYENTPEEIDQSEYLDPLDDAFCREEEEERYFLEHEDEFDELDPNLLYDAEVFIDPIVEIYINTFGFLPSQLTPSEVFDWDYNYTQEEWEKIQTEVFNFYYDFVIWSDLLD